MARRYRKARSSRRRFRRRRFSRRGTARKALRIARSVSRKMAGEVKKMDVNDIIPENKFNQITNALGTAADNPQSLPDFAFLYNVFADVTNSTSDSTQGLQLGDFIGEQIKAKYLYIGIHLQMPVRPAGESPATIQQPLCIRVMVVQDRNYSSTLSYSDMISQLFGVTTGQTTTTTAYQSTADYTLLPINPQEPGRFNVMRDFKMYVAPGYRMDYYKKLMFLQRDMLSGGRFYAGASSAQAIQAPGQTDSTWANMRNRIYVLFLYQSPTLYGVNQTGTPDFTISCQTRLAYYDN